METLLAAAIAFILAYGVYELIEYLNKKHKNLDLNPIIHAAIALVFGVPGICCSALYIAYKSYKLNK